MKTAIVFPGQGSQAVGMADDLIANNATAKTLFQQASDTLGYDLAEIISKNPDDKLNLTQYTQPALLVTAFALWQCWQAECDIKADILAGHSLGEYTALLCAGVIDFPSAVALVAKRGELMQAAVPKGVGSMAAIIGLDDAAVAKVCSELSSADNLVAPANYNSPGQVVIAGHADAVAVAMDACKAAGAKMAKALSVSVPSHSMLLKAAADEFAHVLTATKFHTPKIAVIQNSDVSVHQDPDAIRDSLAKQLYSPVRWVESIQLMQTQGITQIFECGPGKVLSGLVKRIDKQLACQQINSLAAVIAQKGVLNV